MVSHPDPHADIPGWSKFSMQRLITFWTLDSSLDDKSHEGFDQVSHQNCSNNKDKVFQVTGLENWGDCGGTVSAQTM